MGTLTQAQAERFWSRVDRTPGCWLWTSTLDNGYGSINLKIDGRQRNRMAHRLAYEEIIGPIPEGLELDHLCRVPRCVNPAHLEPVTHVENTMRGFSPLAVKARQTHCHRGHEFTAANTYRAGSSRKCRECKRIRERDAYRRKSTAA